MNSPATDWRSLHGSAFDGARVLVTGGAGFIGSHLGLALASLGADVTAVDDLSGGGLPPGESIEPVKLVVGSILDQELLARLTAGCSCVFHLAALGSVPRSVEQPRQYHDVNTTGTLNVLEAARGGGREAGDVRGQLQLLRRQPHAAQGRDHGPPAAEPLRRQQGRRRGADGGLRRLLRAGHRLSAVFQHLRPPPERQQRLRRRHRRLRQGAAGGQTARSSTATASSPATSPTSTTPSTPTCWPPGTTSRWGERRSTSPAACG